VHCAAVVSFQPQDIPVMDKVNIDATSDLVDLALANNIERFVHISSIAALGRHKNDILVDENVEWQDGPLNTAYGISKQMAEREVWRGSAEGLDIIILNPSLIIGAGYWSDGAPALAAKVEKGLAFYPTGSTGFVDVRDVAKLCAKAIELPLSGLRIIVSAENRSYRHFFSMLTDKFGKKKPSVPLGPLLRGIAWRADVAVSKLFRKKQLLSKETLEASSRKGQYDNTLSKEVFTHSYRELDKTIQDLVLAYNNSKNHSNEYGIMPF